jgi:CheY-like chemotaxis protein
VLIDRSKNDQVRRSHNKPGCKQLVAHLLTVLVVEDESSVRDLVTRMLVEKGFAVLTASDAYEALRILAERHVDLLFADIVMPGMDGVQLAKQAKLMRPGLKVLFATGYAHKVTERGAMQVGRVLYKPVRQAELVGAVQAVLAA